jgi:hypothetical protein
MHSGKDSISSADSAQSYFMEQRDTDGSGLILGLLSLFALLFGVLVFWELIGPFHENNIDVPGAIGAAIAGAALSSTALFRRSGAMALNVVGLVLNLSALGAVAFA